MDAAQNGVPIVHIAPPSAGGVSRNQYGQFNVNSNGLILNNSPAAVQTQQGGWITGNLQLGPTPARIILNEVVGANPSQLRGTIEVAGQRADIVVANPNGITCDGCGFLNTTRATLTTGQPQFNGDGSIRGFDVRQGELTIGGNGLNASNLEQLDLIARGVVIEGEVWAKNLNVIAGANQVLHGTLQAAAQGGTGPAPRFAIDIKDLGGMYANQIYLVSNERGLGVNSTGRMAALQGNLALSANGDLTLHDSYAKQNIQASGAGNVKLTGQTVSDGATSIAAAGSLANHGTLDAMEQLTLQAAAIVNSGGKLLAAAGVDVVAQSLDNRAGQILSDTGAQLALGVTLNNAGGILSAKGNLDIHAGTAVLDNTGGTMIADGAVSIAGGNLVNQQGTIDAARQLTVAATGAIDNAGGAMQSGTAGAAAGGGNMHLQSASLNNQGGRLVARDGLAINTGALVNDRAGVAQGVIASTDGAVAVNAAKTSNIGGVITAGTNTTLATQALDNTLGEVSSGAQLAINTNGQALKNDGGKLLAGAGIAVQAGAISSKAGVTAAGIRAAQIAAAGSVNIQASAFANDGSALSAGQDIDLSLGGGALSTAGGAIEAAGSVGITAGAADNQGGRIVGNQGVSAQVANMNNSSGEISSAGDVTLTSAAGVDNSGGIIASNSNLAINASTLTNASGTVSAAGTASLRLGSGLLNNTQGRVVGAQALQLQSGEILNHAGTIASGSALSLDTQGAALTNTGGGQIVASGDLSIASARFDNTGGTAASIGGQLQINTASQQLVNDGGKLQAAGNAAINAGATSSRNGLISGHDVTAVTGNLDNNGGTIAAPGNLDLTTLALSNDGGLLQSVGNARIDTGSQALVNTNSGNTGGIVAGGDLTVYAGSIDSRAGFIAGTGSLALTVAGDLDNRAYGGKAGQIVSNGGGTISSANLFNQQGSINALTNLDVTAGLVDNRAGAIAANGALQLSVVTLDNRADGGVAGVIDAASITATANAIDNRGGSMRAAGNAGIIAAVLDNGSGDISAGNNLNVSAATLSNSGGRLVGNNAVTVSTASQSFGGTIASSNDVTLNVSGDYINSSLLSAQRNLTVNAANITNSGTLKAGDTLTANTGNLANSGEISGQNVVINASGTLTNTASGLIDGVDTRINAGTVNNTGRIYGDFLRVNAGTINNSGSGTVAARNTLLLGAQNLNNTAGGLVYSLGDIGMGGSVDAGGQLQGAMQSLVNASSRIEAAGNLTIAAANLINRNDGLTTMQVVDAPVTKQLVQPAGSATRYPIEQCYGIGGGQDGNGCIVHPDKYGRRSAVTPVYSQVCTFDPNTFNQICTQQPNYAWDAPIFAQFGVATVGVAPPTEPLGGCSMSLEGTIVPIFSPACNQWRSDYAVWDTAFHATLAQLENKVNPYNAEVNEDNRVDTFEDYTLTTLTSTKTRTEVATTVPGQILSGGNMSLSGTVTNQDSQIVAGGALAIAGPAVNNVATQGLERTDYSGTTMFTEVVSCGSFGSKHCRNWYGPNPYNPAPEIVMNDLPTVRYEAAAGNQTLARNLAVATAAIDTSIANATTAAVGNSRTAAAQAVQAVLTANVAAGVAGNAPPVVQSVAAIGAGGAARDVIVTAQPPLAVPGNKLFVLHAEPASRYLVEADPRFTNYRSFISSDYFLQALNRDPERQLKRYGDGFVEQKLVNDQILALSGRRYLSGYSNTEDEYKALMDAGVAFARQYQLTPGVTLSAEQMALLTTDIVWLVERTVMLPDGTSQQVLAPQVYLRRPSGGDLQANGALMAGSDVLIQTEGDLANSGRIAGDTVTALAGRDLVNQSGRISGQDILLRANNDLKNLSGVITGTGTASNVSLLAGRDIVLQTQTLQSANVDGTSTRTSVQRIATVQGGNVQLQAVRDLAAAGAAVKSEGDILAAAGRDIKVAAVAGEYQLDVQDKSGRSTQGRTGYISEAATRNQGSMLTAGRDIALVAANDLSLQGSYVDAGSTGNGNVLLQGRNVSIEAVKDRTAADVQTIGKKSYNRVARDNETLVGGAVTAGDSITVRATSYAPDGAGDITLTGANVVAQKGGVTLVAENNILIQEATTRHAAIDESYVKSGNVLTKVATTKSNSRQVNQAEGSSVSGGTVVARAGNDLTVRGSTVAGDGDVALAAGNKLTVAAATSTSTERQFTKVQENGFLSGGGFGISYGQRITTTELNQEGTTQSGQERSLVGSNHGSLNMVAGDALRVSGSDVAAAQDINLLGKRVTIDEGRDTTQSKLVTKMEQDALTLSIGGSVINALQTMQEMGEAAGKTKNARVKALAAATAAMAAANAAKEIAQNGVNVSISLTAGHSESEQTQTHAASDAIGSTLAAGNNVNIIATGAGKESNLTIQGSDVAAGNNVTLAADNRIDLLAAQDVEEQHSQSKSMNAAAGIAASVGTNGMAFGFTASAGLGRGQEDGSGVTQRNTHVNAGNTLTMASGGDTTIKGAVASGKQVIADIGGDLAIESLQDTARFDSKNQNISVSGTVGFGASVSASFNKNMIQSDYASVQEQSGMAAGDGGFQVNVKGNTDLKGGVIASTQAAIDAGKNSLATGTLTQSDLANHATYKASGFGLSGGFSVAGGDGRDPKATGEGKGPGGTNLMNVASSSGAKMGMPVAMFDSGSDSSVTKSGISAGNITITDEQGQQAKTGQTVAETVAAINRNVATGMDTSGKIANNFDKESVEAGMKVSAAFMRQAAPLVANVVGDIGKSRQDAARDEANRYQTLADDAKTAEEAKQYQAKADEAKATADTWGDNGINRLAVHAAVQSIIGGLAGGSAGALNSGAGVLGGNLGQRLGQQLGEEEADKQGLAKDSKARTDLVNSYQQTFATVGGALAGLAAGSVNGTGIALASAIQGSGAAYAVDEFNRKLHEDRQAKVARKVAAKTGEKIDSNDVSSRMLFDGEAAALQKSQPGTIGTYDPAAIATDLMAAGRCSSGDDCYRLAQSIAVSPGSSGAVFITSAKNSPAVVYQTALSFFGDNFEKWLNAPGNEANKADFQNRIANTPTGIVDLSDFYHVAQYISATKVSQEAGFVSSGTTTWDKVVNTVGNALNFSAKGAQAALLNTCSDCPQSMQQNANLANLWVDIIGSAFVLKDVAALSAKGVGFVATKGSTAAENFVIKNTKPSTTGSSASDISKEINASRDADMTTGLRPASEVNKAFTDKGYTAPFTDGTYVNVTTSKSGVPANMVVSEEQAQVLANNKPAVGAFSTPDAVPSQIYVRERLAITSDMKPDVSKVIPVETTGKPMVQIEGKIAPQEPAGQYPGGGNQTFYDYPVRSTRTDYVKPTGPAQTLPESGGSTPVTASNVGGR